MVRYTLSFVHVRVSLLRSNQDADFELLKSDVMHIGAPVGGGQNEASGFSCDHF